MNGAQALIRTLIDAGVDVCFAKPLAEPGPHSIDAVLEPEGSRE